MENDYQTKRRWRKSIKWKKRRKRGDGGSVSGGEKEGLRGGGRESRGPQETRVLHIQGTKLK